MMARQIEFTICQSYMRKQKVTDFLYWFTTFLALLLFVESIYDGQDIWRIALKTLLFVCCAAGLVLRMLERRKKKSE